MVAVMTPAGMVGTVVTILGAQVLRAAVGQLLTYRIVMVTLITIMRGSGHCIASPGAILEKLIPVVAQPTVAQAIDGPSIREGSKRSRGCGCL